MARTPVTDQLKAGMHELHQGLAQQGGTAKAGEAVLTWIIRRTDLGRDVRLQRFRPYAASTRKQKRKKGQRLQPVSLRDTESMMQGMEVVPVERSWGTQIIESVIRFPARRDADLARIHSDPDAPRTKIPLREFFGMGEEDPEAGKIGQQMGITVHRNIRQDRRTTVKLTIFKARGARF